MKIQQIIQLKSDILRSIAVLNERIASAKVVVSSCGESFGQYHFDNCVLDWCGTTVKPKSCFWIKCDKINQSWGFSVDELEKIDKELSRLISLNAEEFADLFVK